MLYPDLFPGIESSAEHTARTDVGFVDSRKCVGVERPRRCREQAIGLAQPRAIERVANRTCVGEMRLLSAMSNIFLHGYAPR